MRATSVFAVFATQPKAAYHNRYHTHHPNSGHPVAGLRTAAGQGIHPAAAVAVHTGPDPAAAHRTVLPEAERRTGLGLVEDHRSPAEAGIPGLEVGLRTGLGAGRHTDQVEGRRIGLVVGRRSLAVGGWSSRLWSRRKRRWRRGGA